MPELTHSGWTDEYIAARLSAIYGLKFPAAFAPIIRQALEATETPYSAQPLAPDDWYQFRDYYGFMFADFDARVNGLVFDFDPATYVHSYGHSYFPELFTFAWNGGDGVHYGYVDHAPELELTDYPIAQAAPVDKHIIVFGDNTAQGFEGLISVHMHFRDIEEWSGLDSRHRESLDYLR